METNQQTHTEQSDSRGGMRFCQDHWDRLRRAIEDRGLSDLITPDGETAIAQMADQLKRVESGEDPETPVNYDPLMAAHWAIVNNVMGTIGPGALYLMSGGPEDSVDRAQCANPPSRTTWPRCPLCYLNLAHEVSCTDARCLLDKERGYDMWIDRAADDQAAHVAKLRDGSSS